MPHGIRATPKQESTIVALWEKGGLSMVAIGKKVGLGHTCVSDVLARTGKRCKGTMRDWLLSEIRSLRAMRTQGMSIKVIAANLGRSDKSIDGALYAHKIYTRRPHKKWTKLDDTTLRRFYRKISNNRLAFMLDTTRAVVKVRAKYLGIYRQGHRYWSKEDSELAVKLKDEGLKYKDIVGMLSEKRTIGSVKHRVCWVRGNHGR